MRLCGPSSSVCWTFPDRHDGGAPLICPRPGRSGAVAGQGVRSPQHRWFRDPVAKARFCPFVLLPSPMARRHWLDPLARRLLIACGQIAPAAPDAAGQPAATRQEPTRLPASARVDRSEVIAGLAGLGRPEERDEAVERELLALRLVQDPSQPLRDAEDVRRAAALGWRLDVNRASAADWRRLPGCGPERVDLLARLQRGGIQLSGPEDLQAVLDLDADTLACWLPVLTFRWYGENPAAPPTRLAVNLADPSSLARLPGLTPERCSRLVRERARSPFRDLADLRDRLSLPAAVVERWIGRVSFQAGAAGPQLPPTARAPRKP